MTINSLNQAYADYKQAPSVDTLTALFSALRSYATSLVQGFPLSDREDAVQGIVVKLWANLPGFTGKSSFRTWAHSVMLNFFRDQLRAEIRWEQRHRAFRARIEQQHEPDDITPQDILRLNLSPEDTHLLTIFVKLRDYESTAEYLHITPTQLKKKLRSIIPAASK